jgi:hypothetical protein
MLCQYKDILGKPNQGIHRHRMFGIAIVDVILTILGARVLSKIFNVKFIHVLIFLFLLGILLHWLFCVDTTVNMWLFGKN